MGFRNLEYKERMSLVLAVVARLESGRSIRGGDEYEVRLVVAESIAQLPELLGTWVDVQIGTDNFPRFLCCRRFNHHCALLGDSFHPFEYYFELCHAAPCTRALRSGRGKPYRQCGQHQRGPGVTRNFSTPVLGAFCQDHVVLGNSEHCCP
jgi:hypothetical protein